MSNRCGYVRHFRQLLDQRTGAGHSNADQAHGDFKDLAEFDAVATNISMVMAGIDPETKIFTDPQMAIKKEIEDVSSDKSIPPSEKRNLLEQLNAAFQAAEPIRFPTNIELVTKYYDKLEVTTIAISDDDGRSASSVARTISEAK
jgi:hypothetical protein